MKTHELASLLGTTNQTIGNWIEKFSNYFSPAAQKKEGKYRSFTDDDLIALATIAKLSHEGLNYDGIGKRLAEGYRVESLSSVNYGVDTRMIPAAAMEQVIDSTGLRIELEQVKSERDRLLSEVDGLKTELKQKDTASAEKADHLQQQINTLLREIADLTGQMKAAQKEADMLREQQERQQNKRRWWGGNG